MKMKELNVYRARIEKSVEETLGKVTTPEFWTEVGPDLSAKFKQVAHYIGQQASLATLQIVTEEIELEKQKYKKETPSGQTN